MGWSNWSYTKKGGVIGIGAAVLNIFLIGYLGTMFFLPVTVGLNYIIPCNGSCLLRHIIITDVLFIICGFFLGFVIKKIKYRKIKE